MKQFFKIKNGTDYDKAVKKHFLLKKRWSPVFKKVSDLLGEEIKEMVLDVKSLRVNASNLTLEDNKKLFGKNGKLKNNSKKAKEVHSKYLDIIKEVGLAEYEDLGRINFSYGIMRFAGEELRSFVTSEDDIFYEANFDLEKRSKGLVTPITEIEYEEKYLEELKKHSV